MEGWRGGGAERGGVVVVVGVGVGGSDTSVVGMSLSKRPHRHASNSGGRTPGSKLPAYPPPSPP